MRLEHSCVKSKTKHEWVLVLLLYLSQKLTYNGSIIGLNVKWEITEVLGENIGENLDDFGFDDDFLDLTPKAWPLKKQT